MRHPYAAGREAIQFTFTLGEDPVLAEAIALAQKDVDEEFGPGQLVVTGFGENGEVLCQVDTPSDRWTDEEWAAWEEECGASEAERAQW